MFAKRCPVAVLTALFAFLAASAQDAPPAGPPAGVEVQARGPVHEAFASPTAAPVATPPVAKRPPANIDELPPDEKPDGDAVWIGGYWHYDDEAKDFLWVSGVWRKVPPGKTWVAGYWREEGTDWQWVPGFWATAKATKAAKGEEEQQQQQDVTYLPSPPAPPNTAPPGPPPQPDLFYVPGAWVWRGTAYAWRPGYWARSHSGYVWVADHYRWTPSGYVYVPGYWDLALSNRGILYAPVVFRPDVVRVGFVYTPTYAVRDTVIVNAMFVRPSVSHYYFGDYYGVTYTRLGFESCVVYSRRCYDPVIVYETCHRRDPGWLTLQINLFNDRSAGRAPRPPRTLVQQNTFVRNNVTNVTQINNITMIAPPAQVAASKSTKLVKLDAPTRQAARVQAQNLETVSRQRAVSEVKPPPGSPRVARSTTLTVPKAQPVKPGMTVPRAPATPPSGTARLGAPMARPAETKGPPASSPKKPGSPTPAVPKVTPPTPMVTPTTPSVTPTTPKRPTPPTGPRGTPPKLRPTRPKVPPRRPMPKDGPPKNG